MTRFSYRFVEAAAYSKALPRFVRRFFARVHCYRFDALMCEAGTWRPICDPLWRVWLEAIFIAGFWWAFSPPEWLDHSDFDWGE